MNEICPCAEKCPIFSGVLKENEISTIVYQNLYCNVGEKGRANCRRWQVREIYGICPPNVLPNSFDTVEEIAKKNNLVDRIVLKST